MNNKQNKMSGREVKTLDVILENLILLNIICDMRDALRDVAYSPDEDRDEVKTDVRKTLEKYKNIREFVELELEEMRKL